MKLSTHCSWANLKDTWSLEVCSDWLCRKLVTSAHYVPQHPLHHFMWPTTLWLRCCRSQLLPLCYNTTDSWLWNIKEQSTLEFTELLRVTHCLTNVCKTVCMPRCFFYTPVAMEVIGSPDFNYLDGWMNTFGNIVYIRPIRLHLCLLSDLNPVSLNTLKLMTDLYLWCSAGHAADIWFVADWFHEGPKPTTRWCHAQPTRPGGEIHHHANWLCRTNGGFAFVFKIGKVKEQKGFIGTKLKQWNVCWSWRCSFLFYILEWLPLPSVW